MCVKRLYNAYFVLFFKKHLTEKQFRDDLYDLRKKVRAIDMEELLELILDDEASNTRTKLLRYFSNTGEVFPFPIMLYYPKLCLRYYEETGDSEILVNLNECSTQHTDTISSTIGMKCDSEAVYKMRYTINYNDLFTGLCDSPKSLEERNRFIDELFDRIDPSLLEEGRVILHGTDMYEHYYNHY